MQILRENKRTWDLLKEDEKIRYVLKDKLRSKPFYLKGSNPPIEFIMGDITDDTIDFHTITGLPRQDTITLYLTVNRHIEVDFQVRDVIEDKWILVPTLARIGRIVRAHPRYATADGLVYAANFRVSKNEIGADFSKLQIASQVVLRDFERQFNETYPGLRIFTPTDRERPIEMKPLETLMIPFVLAETQNGESYDVPIGETTYRKALEATRTFESARLKLAELKSLLVFPIIIEEKGKKYLLAHIYCPLKKDVDLESIKATFLEKSEEIAERIREVNTVTIKDRQTVKDISLGGLALEVTNADLKKYLPVGDRITFDLIFKMQAPLRFHGRICHIAEVEDGNLLAGVNIEGSGHTDFKKTNQERLGSLIQLIKAES